MSFININNGQIHTSSINTTGSTLTVTGTGSTWVSTTTSTSGYSIYSPKVTYHILGDDVEIDGYVDINIAMLISTLNVLGKPFYDEIKKQHISLPEELESFIEKRLVIFERDRKIDDVINNKNKT